MIPLLTLFAGLAWADPCATTDSSGFATGPIPTGPVPVGYLDGDLGVAHRLCGRTEVSLGAGGLAVVDTANFYGHIVAGGTLSGSWAATDRTEIYAAIEAFRYDSVITPIPATYMGFGHVSLGASQRLWESDNFGIGAHGRLVVPTAVGLYRNAYPLGLDLGVSALWAAHRTFRVHGDVGGLGSAAISAGPALPWAGARVTVGAEWQPVRPFAVVVDLDSAFGYTDAVDHVAGSLGLRAGIGKRVGLELAASYPFAGRERALATGELRVDVRLGELPEEPKPTPAPP